MKQILPIALIMLILSGYINIAAQDNVKNYIPHDYSVIPPSPEVASLMKYIDFPISHFTGQPDINIPIYTVKEGGISIPISISYHGGGIKVHEQPGIIGLGWTLQAGATVSRTVYGLPDEFDKDPASDLGSRGLFNLRNKDRRLREIVISRDIEYSHDEPKNDFIKEVASYSYNYEEGKVDMANDVMQFYGMGFSGTFMYDEKQRQMTLSTSSPVSISPTSVSQRSFPMEYIITDKNETKYTFGEMELTRYEYSYMSVGKSVMDSVNCVSAWHLSNIKNLYNDVVTFHYSNARYKRINTGGYYSYLYSNKTNIASCQLTVDGQNLNYYPKVLTQIKGKSVTVNFYYDIYFDVLEKITVHRNDANSTMIKQFELAHSTIRMGNYDKLILSEIAEITQNKRLVLYKFGYNEGSTITNNYVRAQDHWGFYNGKDNLTLLPEYWGKITEGYNCADREPVYSCTLIGTLKSITYPTGGSTLFDWEQNDYSYIQNCRIAPKQTSDTTFSEYNLSGIEQCEKLEIGPIEIKTNNSLSIDLSKYIKNLMDSQSGMAMWNDYYTTHTGFNNDYTFPRVEIINQKTGKVSKCYYIDKDNCDSNPIKYFSDIGTYIIKLRNPRDFDGVDANIINGYFGHGSEAHCYQHGYIPITLKTISEKYTPTTKSWGGLRIAKISSISNETGSISKKYNYLESDGKYSTGVIAMEPSYEYNYYKFYRVEVSDVGSFPDEVELKCISSNGLYSTPLGGARIEYGEVCESYEGDQFKNIKTKYFFSSQYTSSDKINCLFYGSVSGGARMLTSYSHSRGDLLRKEFIQNNTILKEFNYKYRIFEGSSPIFTGPFAVISDGSLIWVSQQKEKDYTVCRYKLIPYNKVIETETTRERDGNIEHVDSVYYSYFRNEYTDNHNNSFVRSKSYIDSNDNIVTTYYSYIWVNGHPIDLKETEVSVINGRIISAKKMIYDNNSHKLIAVYSAPANLAVQSNFKLGVDFSASTALLNAINLPEYNYRYDSDGNLVEIRYNGEVLASYLWGYKGTYPIAEIKAIPYDELVNKLPNGYKPAQLLDATNLSSEALNNNIRNNLAEYDVTTMTYHWLIGVSTATDSRGITTHFTFDDFGRLSDVKDYNQYFIRKYDYNYKGQN